MKWKSIPIIFASPYRKQTHKNFYAGVYFFAVCSFLALPTFYRNCTVFSAWVPLTFIMFLNLCRNFFGCFWCIVTFNQSHLGCNHELVINDHNNWWQTVKFFEHWWNISTNHLSSSWQKFYTFNTVLSIIPSAQFHAILSAVKLFVKCVDYHKKKLMYAF